MDFPKDKKQTELQKKKLKSIKRRGLIFDKGGAIFQIQKKNLPKQKLKDLVLLLDSDIVLPPDFKDLVANTQIEKNTIYAYREDYLFYDDFEKTKNAYDYSAFEGASFFNCI